MFNCIDNKEKIEKFDIHEKYLKKQSSFQPYVHNGGTIVAIAGEDFAIIGSDKRLVNNYDIYTRNQSKLFKLTDKTVLGSVGCWCDVDTFRKILEMKVKMYKFDHNQEISIESISRLISILLYNRRFFPYYVENITCGLDKDGKGYVTSYDSIGSYERYGYTSKGSSSSLIYSILDNQIGFKNLEGYSNEEKKLSLEQAIKILKDCFNSASERDIIVGDGIHLNIITKDGIKEETFELKKD